MKKEDINFEFISKIEIKVDDSLFYIPREIIKGKILIYPKYQMKFNITKLHLILKIMQYEFWDYSNKEINELKNIKITNIQTEEIEYKLKEEEISIDKNFESFSIIDKEDENKIISIPFQIKINEENILPTFQFDDSTYFLGIRHLLLVECKDYYSSNYIGLFIGKNQNKKYIQPKEIKENFKVGFGSLEIKVNYPKLSYKFDEEINLEISTNSNLKFKKITEIEQKFYRNIKWKGYMKNTLLNKNIYHTQKYGLNENKYGLLYMKNTLLNKNIYHTQKYGLNENKYGLLAKINAPFFPIESSIVCGAVGMAFGVVLFPFSILGGIIGVVGLPVGAIVGAGYGLYETGKVMKDVLNLNEKENNFNNNFKSRMDNDDEEQLLSECLKKFIYFKDNKIVGFIKFSKNITPPVSGYYFECNFNMKIEVQISGVILNSNKFLKTQIDMYDSDEYINKMKKIFKN